MGGEGGHVTYPGALVSVLDSDTVSLVSCRFLFYFCRCSMPECRFAWQSEIKQKGKSFGTRDSGLFSNKVLSWTKRLAQF